MRSRYAHGASLCAQGAPLCVQGHLYKSIKIHELLRVRPCALKVRPSALKEIYKNVSIENPELTKGQLRKSGIDGFNAFYIKKETSLLDLLNAAFSLEK